MWSSGERQTHTDWPWPEGHAAVPDERHHRLSRQGRPHARPGLHGRTWRGHRRDALACVVPRRHARRVRESGFPSTAAEPAFVQLGPEVRISVHGRLPEFLERRKALAHAQGRRLVARHHGSRRIESAGSVSVQRRDGVLAELVAGRAVESSSDTAGSCSRGANRRRS